MFVAARVSVSAYFLFCANAPVYSFCLCRTYARAHTYVQTRFGSFAHTAGGAVDYSFLCTNTHRIFYLDTRTLFPMCVIISDVVDTF